MQLNIRHRYLVLGALAAILAAICVPAMADPPAQAPAHGWRKKHDPYYVGYTGHEWPQDYGVVEGGCNHKEVGTVVGAVIGGAIGSKAGDDSNRTVAVIVGAVLGGIVGREIGRDMDNGDRGCFGHTLELAKDGQNVHWQNTTTGVSYFLTPVARTKSDGASCRQFKLMATRAGTSSTQNGRACRSGESTWEIK